MFTLFWEALGRCQKSSAGYAVMPLRRGRRFFPHLSLDHDEEDPMSTDLRYDVFLSHSAKANEVVSLIRTSSFTKTTWAEWLR
jgi:hypothetical protein